MKKHIFLVFGLDVDPDEHAYFTGLKKMVGKNCTAAQIIARDPEEILRKTLDLIRPENPRDYMHMIVIYGGGNFQLFANNMPCDSLDFNLLRNKLIEVVGGKDTPQQRYLVCTLFAGALISVLNLAK